MISKYNQLVPVIFGSGAVSRLGEQVKAMGCKKVMCVYDGGVKAAGIGEKAESSLKAAGVDFIVFDKIAADPPSSIIDEASAIARAEKVDGLIGVGGGSSMDSSKAIALMTDRPGSIRQYLQGPPLFLTSSVPIVLVPTTSGTGSECTQVCVITHEDLNAKLAVFVRSSLAIVDPELVKSLPPAGTASTGLDSFAHAAESVTANNWNPRSELLALTAISKITKYLPIACKDGANMEARTEMSLASNWAGIAFADTDVHVGHCVADAFSVGFHTPHGLNCAWATPEVMILVAPVVSDKVKLIGEAMGVVFSASDTPEVIGEKTASAMRELMKNCGIKSPREMGLDRIKAISCAKYVMESGLRFNCPVEITGEIATKLMTQSFDNYI